MAMFSLACELWMTSKERGINHISSKTEYAWEEWKRTAADDVNDAIRTEMLWCIEF